jgi:hypothetical protein
VDVAVAVAYFCVRDCLWWLTKGRVCRPARSGRGQGAHVGAAPRGRVPRHAPCAYQDSPRRRYGTVCSMSEAKPDPRLARDVTMAMTFIIWWQGCAGGSRGAL